MTIHEIYDLFTNLKEEEIKCEHATLLMPLVNSDWNLCIRMFKRNNAGIDRLLHAAKLLTPEQREIILSRNIRSKDNILSAVFESENKKNVTELLGLLQQLTPIAQANFLQARLPCYKRSFHYKTILSIVIHSYSDEVTTVIPLIVRNKEISIENKYQLFQECWIDQPAKIIQLQPQRYFLFVRAHGYMLWEKSIQVCIQDLNKICENIPPSDTASCAETQSAIHENANIIFLKYLCSNKTRIDKNLFIKELTAFLETARTNAFFQKNLNRFDFSVLPQYLCELFTIVGIPYRIYHVRRNALNNRSLFFPSPIETSMNRIQDTLHHQRPIEVPYSRWRALSFVSFSILLSTMILPSFDFGLKLGVIETLFSVAIYYSKNYLVVQNHNNSSGANSEYGRYLLSNPLVPCLLSPVLEELLFRGLIQNGLHLFIFSCVLESPEAKLFNLNSIEMVSLLLASLIFGLVHITNRHDHANFQAVSSTISGLFYGWLNLQAGIYCSMAAHMIHNTLLMTYSEMELCINNHKYETLSSTIEGCTEIVEQQLGMKI